MKPRHGIVRQAGLRLVISLGLFVLLLALTTAGIYQAALHKAAHERAEDLAVFYQARMAQLERDWELQTRDLRVRIEYTRILEGSLDNLAQLQAFLTIQGSDRRFQYLLIQSRDGRKLFDFGKDLALAAIPASADEPLGHYFSPADGQLYRVFQEPIWLGEQQGMGRCAVFFRVDSSLLHQIGTPGLTLSLTHDGRPIASSGGQAAIDRLARGVGLADADVRELPWAGVDQTPILLRLEAPVKPLFSSLELILGMSAIPVLDGLILWLAIGVWLMRQSKRISALGDAVHEYAVARQDNPTLEEALARARGDGREGDEISKVSLAIGAMLAAIEQREGEREAALAQVVASEARIREVTSALADGVLVVDADGAISFVNPRAEALLGWRESELLGRDSHQTLHATDPDGRSIPLASCLVHAAIREGRPYQSGLDWFLRRDGGHLPVSLAATPLHREGRGAGAVVTFQDVSARLEAEQALKASELRFRTLFNSSGDAILVHPLEGEDGGLGRFIEVNEVACERLGYSREELFNMTPLDLDEAGTFAGPADIQAFQQHVLAAGHVLFERVHVAKDGRRIPVEISAHVFDLKGVKSMLSVVRDISERKQAEAEYLTIQQATPDGFWLISARDGRFLDVNPAYCEMIGYSREALLGMTVADIEAMQNPEEVKAHIEVLLSGRIERFETRHRRQDGSLMDVEVGAKYVDVRGGIIVVFIRDISARIAAERAVRESEARLRAATRAGIIGIWDWDIQHGALIWDEAMYRLYGLQPGTAPIDLQRWSAALHPDDRARVEAEIQAALRGEREYAADFRVIWPDGAVRYLRAASETMRDAEGAPSRMIGINYDMTEQKRAEREIAALLDFNRKVIAESTLGILVYEADGPCVLANEAAAIILGATQEQLLAQNFREIPSWQETGLLTAALSTLESGAHRQVEARFTTSFGRDVWVVCELAALGRETQPRLLLIINDVSGYRQAERQAREARAEAERANRAKSEFLANMSHEIRTPMNAILGLSDLALGQAELSPKLRDYLTKIHTSSQALLAILNDILDYSKVEAGRLELDNIAFNLDEVLESVANLFGVRADEKGLEMVFDVAPSIPAALVGDPLRLGQVMNNLVGNAVKFTAAGEILVKVEELARAQGLISLRFSVRDTGIGMDADQLGRLFQAFTQADGSITRRFGGTGLGLTISKRLVERMGGEIRVESEPGRGSCFSFELRLPVAHETRIQRSPEQLRGMRVLVVDDLESSRLILEDILTAWGFSVRAVASGEEALACLAEVRGPDQAFELILLDWRMPGLDGVQVASRVGELVRQGLLPALPVIIMVTAYGKERLLEEARGTWLDAILTKPITASHLFDTIARLQGGVVPQEAAGSGSDLAIYAAMLAGSRVLLVEDNEINQTVAKDLLERMGVRVGIAQDGGEALEFLELEPFDAVLMDLQMPVMDGFEATRRIRADARWRRLPVIAMTAAAMSRDREACMQAGMNDHVAKPILPGELAATLCKWLRPGAPVQPLPAAQPAALPDSGLPEAMPGFDSGQIRALLGNNDALFRQLARQFAEQYAGFGVDLGDALVAGDGERIVRLAHQLKSAAGHLGAQRLSRLAAEIQEETDGVVLADRIKSLQAALREVLDSIARLAAPEPAALTEAYDCPRCDRLGASDRLRQLRELVANFDYVPHELVAELRECLACQPLRGHLERLERALGNMDYALATSILDEFRCDHGHDLWSAHD